jgi:hypothetical protein
MCNIKIEMPKSETVNKSVFSKKKKKFAVSFSFLNSGIHVRTKDYLMISPPHDLFDYEQLFIHVCHVAAESLTPSMVDYDYSICNEYLHILNIHGRSSMEL